MRSSQHLYRKQLPKNLNSQYRSSVIQVVALRYHEPLTLDTQNCASLVLVQR